MKKTLLAICLVFLFVPCSFAGDLIIAPIINKPAPGGMDTYVITDNNGNSEVVNVISLDNVSDGAYAVVNEDGDSTVIMKMGD